MENTTVQIAVILAVLAILVIFVITLRKGQTSKRLIDSYTSTLGFSPVRSPEKSFLARIIQLYARSTDDELAITNVFFSDRQDYQIHLFDLLTRARDADSSVIVDTVVVISSPHLRLPRLAVRPKMNMSGRLGSMLSTALNKRISASPPKDLQRIQLHSHAGVSDKYVLFALGPMDDGTRLSEKFLAYLATTEWYVIEAEGEILALNKMDFDAVRLGGRLTGEAIKGFIDDAARFYELLRESYI